MLLPDCPLLGLSISSCFSQSFTWGELSSAVVSGQRGPGVSAWLLGSTRLQHQFNRSPDAFKNTRQLHTREVPQRTFNDRRFAYTEPTPGAIDRHHIRLRSARSMRAPKGSGIPYRLYKYLYINATAIRPKVIRFHIDTSLTINPRA